VVLKKDKENIIDIKNIKGFKLIKVRNKAKKFKKIFIIEL
jgi:hypothetical protein